MRNIFDQYSQPENKLTHALITCLNEDKNLLRDFLRTFVGLKINKTQRLVISEQSLPNSQHYSEVEAEKAGLPDAIIYTEELDWILVIENKISCGLTQDQLNRHYKTIAKYGFEKIYGLTLTIQEYNFRDDNWKHVYWTDIYSWLCAYKDKSNWSKTLIDYLEVLEMKLANDEYLTEGTLTTFTGIPFNAQNLYNYPEAKRVLKLLMNKLRQHKELETEINLDLTDPGRSAITSGSSVWDYIPVKSKGLHFTKVIHFGVGIGMESAGFGMVLPDKLETKLRKEIKSLGYEKFKSLIRGIVEKADKYFKSIDGYVPSLKLDQRRWYKSINSVPVNDAVIEFDLRTAFPDLNGNDNQAIKTQEEWLKASYEAFCSKNSNIQISIRIKFPYERGHGEINSTQAEELCVKSWLCCQDFLREISE